MMPKGIAEQFQEVFAYAQEHCPDVAEWMTAEFEAAEDRRRSWENLKKLDVGGVLERQMYVSNPFLS